MTLLARLATPLPQTVIAATLMQASMEVICVNVIRAISALLLFVRPAIYHVRSASLRRIIAQTAIHRLQ